MKPVKKSDVGFVWKRPQELPRAFPKAELSVTTVTRGAWDLGSIEYKSFG